MNYQSHLINRYLFNRASKGVSWVDIEYSLLPTRPGGMVSFSVGVFIWGRGLGIESSLCGLSLRTEGLETGRLFHRKLQEKWISLKTVCGCRCCCQSLSTLVSLVSCHWIHYPSMLGSLFYIRQQSTMSAVYNQDDYMVQTFPLSSITCGFNFNFLCSFLKPRSTVRAAPGITSGNSWSRHSVSVTKSNLFW